MIDLANYSNIFIKDIFQEKNFLKNLQAMFFFSK